MGQREIDHVAEEILAARQDRPATLAQFDDENTATLQAAITIPAGLRMALETNPKFAQTFHQIVSEVVRMTFIHPDTKPRVMSASIIQERAHLCLYALDQMYNEHGFGLRQCYDQLPDVIINAIRMGMRAEDVAAQGTAGKWTRTVVPVEAPGEFGSEAFSSGEDLNQDRPAEPGEGAQELVKIKTG